MDSMSKYTVDELIKIYVNPLIGEECRRLKIPRKFIEGVYGCYSKDFISGYLEEIRNEKNELIGVRIRIADNNSPRDVLSCFFHLMYHAKELNEKKKRFLSGLRAMLYAEKRIAQLALSGYKYLKREK